MWKGKKVSVVFPAYNEEDNIKAVIDEFSAIKEVDEIVVANNNSTDRTVEEVKKTKARIVNETRQGEGYAIRAGLKAATGDYIIYVESDRTFFAKDIYKFLVYAEDFEVVAGSRTSKEFIQVGAVMNLFHRTGNWMIGKLMSVLFRGVTLTDVGCGYRLIRKEALERIQDNFTQGKSPFLPEYIILCLEKKIKVCEIPVHYTKRSGPSKIITSNWKAVKVALMMTKLILRYWIGFPPRPKD